MGPEWSFREGFLTSTPQLKFPKVTAPSAFIRKLFKYCDLAFSYQKRETFLEDIQKILGPTSHKMNCHGLVFFNSSLQIPYKLVLMGRGFSKAVQRRNIWVCILFKVKNHTGPAQAVGHDAKKLFPGSQPWSLEVSTQECQIHPSSEKSDQNGLDKGKWIHCV